MQNAVWSASCHLFATVTVTRQDSMSTKQAELYYRHYRTGEKTLHSFLVELTELSMHCNHLYENVVRAYRVAYDGKVSCTNWA